jgi:hypothetical protein
MKGSRCIARVSSTCTLYEVFKLCTCHRSVAVVVKREQRTSHGNIFLNTCSHEWLAPPDTITAMYSRLCITRSKACNSCFLSILLELPTRNTQYEWQQKKTLGSAWDQGPLP